jgi:DNA polymerase-3 subunit delta
MRPEDLDRSIAKGEISPLYFIYGEEEFLVDRAVQRLVDKLVSPDFRDFNFTLFYGKECRGEQIIENAMTLPMFAERRVILVKRAEELQAETLELLIPYLHSPSPESCIVFQGAKIDQRRKFFLELKKTDLLIEYKKMKDEQLPGFIQREAERGGKRFEAAAAEMLVYYSGNNLRELVSQIEKLSAYAGQRSAITVDDVRSMASDTKIDTAFELADALGNRNLDRAVRQMQTIARDADALFPLVGALARHFRQLTMIKELLDKRIPQDEISRRVKINPYFLKGMLQQANKFRMAEFRKILTLLHELDIGLKSGGRGETLLEMLVYEVCLRGESGQG